MLISAAVLALLAAAASDVYRRLIPDVLCATLAALGVVHLALAGGAMALFGGAILAALMFAMGVAAFVGGLVGGGDVKLLAATGFWVPWRDLGEFALIVSIAGAVLAVGVLVVRGARRWHRGARIESAASVPYGAAIAFGGCAVMLAPS